MEILYPLVYLLGVPLHFIARFLHSICTSILDPTMDAITLITLSAGNESETDYGRERFFAKVLFNYMAHVA